MILKVLEMLGFIYDLSESIFDPSFSSDLEKLAIFHVIAGISSDYSFFER